jgi:glutamate-1-semialdehyde 2,1-aminomutase
MYTGTSLSGTSRFARSRELFARIARTIAGGESSYARLKKGLELCFDHGEGSHFWDIDGNEYIDYSLGYGPLLFGHRPQWLIEAVMEAVAHYGTLSTFPYELDAEVGELIAELVPGVELLRFANSGTEATMAAARLARAYTGRTKIVQMEGGYHGWADTHFWSSHPDVWQPTIRPYSPTPIPGSRGIPAAYGEALLIAQYNDREGLERLFAEHGSDIAAVLVEPVQCNSGVILPEPGYLEFLREITKAYGALLIFDEVITGFRLAPGGAQERFGVIPDLATFAKALGGGFPIAAFGGSAEVMALEATNQVMHGGTYTANVLALAAAKAVLTRIREQREAIWAILDGFGEQLRQGLQEACEAAGLRCIVQGIGPVWHIFFAKRDAPDLDRIRNYRDAHAYASIDLFDRFHRAMLERGVYFHPYHLERWFLSAVHTADDIAQTLQAAAQAAAEVAASLRRQPEGVGSLTTMSGIAQ